MSYKSYAEQICAHVMFLRSKGFEITELAVNTDFVRCHQTGSSQYRGELAYKTRTVKLDNGLTGIQTWFRGPQGETSSFQTYGLGLTEHEQKLCLESSVGTKYSKDNTRHEAAGKKAYGFWLHSLTTGRSEYLDRKKVGSYGIRFRSSAQYGDVAVVPMTDASGRLWNYQLLNPDGTKRQPKDARTEDLFHVAGVPVDGHPIGVAESYVTAASCFELTGIPTACAFSCENLKTIAMILKQKYHKSQLVIFADNDRHLQSRGVPNKGLLKAREALNAVGARAVLVVPDFGVVEAHKGLSDWNDLINQRGLEYAKAQVDEQLRKTWPRP